MRRHGVLDRAAPLDENMKRRPSRSAAAKASDDSRCVRAIKVRAIWALSLFLFAGEAHAFTIATFGTSLTSRGGWQAPLARALSQCRGEEVSVLNLGRAGASSNWGARAVARLRTVRADVFLVEFAVNDSALNRLTTISRSTQNMSLIAAEIRNSHPDAKISFMRMNPVLGVSRIIRPLREAYERSHADLARQLGIGYIDFLPFWERLGEEALRAALPDGSHPDSEIASEIIVPVLARTLAPVACRSGDSAG